MVVSKEYKEDCNPWTYKGIVFEPYMKRRFFGFVYCITDSETGQKYIGKKHFYTRRKNPKTGRREKKESNWMDYYSSHEELKKLGKAEPRRFDREILYLCTNLGETNYMEILEQFQRNVLSDPNYLNDNINGKWFKKNVLKYPNPTEIYEATIQQTD